MKSYNSGKAQRIDLNSLALAYLAAKEHVIKSGYAQEIDWQNSLNFRAVTESVFLREAAWVILSAGMRESVVRSKFDGISRAFLQWASAEEILRQKASCEERAYAVFGSRRKIGAIGRLIEIVVEDGFDQVKKRIEEQGLKAIRKFPFMGPATANHFAKNIGLDMVKPDRHLLRIAAVAGYATPSEMCQDISRITHDKVSVIDLVIWRFATIKREYLDFFFRV